MYIRIIEQAEKIQHISGNGGKNMSDPPLAT